MKKKYLASILGAFVLGTAMVYGANVHLVGEPTIEDNGNTLTVCYKLAGLGNQDITVTLTTTGEATAQCVSPGGNLAPGQNKVPVQSTISHTIRASSINRQRRLSTQRSARAPGWPAPFRCRPSLINLRFYDLLTRTRSLASSLRFEHTKGCWTSSSRHRRPSMR